MKTASIYKRSNKGYILFGLSKTVSGFRIASEPFFNISEKEASPMVIANAIKKSLVNDDTQRVANPKNWSEFNKTFLKKIGLKSLKELDNQETKLVTIKEDGNNIIFEPNRFHDKPSTGFISLDKDDSIKISNETTDDEIIKAYEFVLTKCVSA
jgi:hypothetical protein